MLMQKYNEMQDYELRFLSQKVKVEFLTDYKNDSLRMNYRAGTITSIPRMQANLLAVKGHCVYYGDSTERELNRSEGRQIITKGEMIAEVESRDLFLKVKDLISRSDDRQKLVLRSKLESYIASRIPLIASHASVSPLTDEMKQKLTYEEEEFYKVIHNEFQKLATKITVIQ